MMNGAKGKGKNVDDGDIGQEERRRKQIHTIPIPD